MSSVLSAFLSSQPCRDLFDDIYGSHRIDQGISRCHRVIKKFQSHFETFPEHLFSTPGRTEIGGNHTDHNLGRVIAGAVTLDALAAVSRRDDLTCTLISKGFDSPFSVHLGKLEPETAEAGTTESLIRGVAAGLNRAGYAFGGFDAYLDSSVLPGSGLSSSAAVEVLIGSILNGLYNGSRVSPLEIARIGQFAENRYMGKPSGLMDQTACACGGIVTIDFQDQDNPEVRRVSLDLREQQYTLLVVDTRGNHANLTPEYAAIPLEMRCIAGLFGKEQLRQVKEDQVLQALPDLRRSCGDRSVLRALHFFAENRRVLEQTAAIREGRFQDFLHLVRASGRSSWELLQNISVPSEPKNQELALALGLTGRYIRETGKGACRVHGGGFAGTIQVFLPDLGVPDYVTAMEDVFGTGAVTTLGFRSAGTMMMV